MIVILPPSETKSPAGSQQPLSVDSLSFPELNPVRERLISFLLATAKRFGVPQKDGTIVLEVPLRHQDIASSISATRETTSRELAVLERHGLVGRDRQSIITLLDTAKLRTYLE